MSVTLELRPDLEAQLAAQAAARGLSLEDYLKNIVELQFGPGAALQSHGAANSAEWEREFEAFIDTFPQQPLLSNEAISRESIYTREDEL